jgi:hypothetical protein
MGAYRTVEIRGEGRGVREVKLSFTAPDLRDPAFDLSSGFQLSVSGFAFSSGF